MKSFMKKSFVIMSLSALIVGCSAEDANPGVATISPAVTGDAKITQEFDFRNTSWGMTQDEVEAIEIGDLIAGDLTFLAFRVSDNNLRAVAKYEFIDDRLVAGEYSIKNDETVDYQMYEEQYDKLKEILTEKYGESEGMTSYTSIWETDRTLIILVLNEDDASILSASYASLDRIEDLSKSNITSFKDM